MLTGNNVCSHVKVAVRVRPENEREKQGNYSNVVQVVDEHMLVFDPKEEEINFFQGQVSKYRDINKRQKKDLKFVFDRVFDENATQLEVFESTTKIILDGVLNGYNCSVLAYGATGAGKTFTMVGSPTDPGVMYQTMMDLYKRIDEIKDEKLCSVAVSYLEVYNEQIRDLLTCCGPLALREDAQKGVVVQGLTLHQPNSAQQILEMLDYGNKNRTQHPTDMNASSSRSHAVFQIYLRQQDKTASIRRNVRIAKMCLIDLAGSERVSATNANGILLREGANINRSLLALGNVINALADPKSKKQHIPYRNSKLTRLLKDSLGGNCQTIMIAAVSPSSLSYDDTYNTLKYANRAKDIKASLKSNIVNLDSHITQYAMICEQQKKEILMLKQKLQAYEDKHLHTAENPTVNLAAINSQQEAEFKRYREILNQIFTARGEIKKNYLDLGKRLKVNELKAQHQEEHHHQIQLLCSDERVGKATCKRERILASLKVHNVHNEEKKQEVAERLEENSNCLNKVENEMHLLGQDGQIPEVLQKELQCHYLQLEVQDIKQQMEDMVQLVTLQEEESKRTIKILNYMLPVLKQQYSILKAARLTNATTESQFREVEHLIQREKGVVWADQIAAEENSKHFPYALSYIASHPHLQCSESCSDSSMDKENVQAIPVERSRECPVKILKSPVLQSKENVQPASNEKVCQHKPPRRKLMDSPLDQYNPKVLGNSSVPVLNDSLSNEGFIPIQYTPDGCRTLTVQNHCKQTVEFKTSGLCQLNNFDQKRNTSGDADCSSGMNVKDVTLILTECTMNSTFILSPGVHRNNCDADAEVTKETCQPHGNESMTFQRSNLPDTAPSRSLPPVPSYMAMTSAAQGKRKLLRDDLQSAVGPKRIRQDVWPGSKPLRVLKKGINCNGHKQEVERPNNTQLGRSMFWKATKSEFSRNFSNRY